MDFGLLGRVAVVAGKPLDERVVFARALTDEGAKVVETDLESGVAAVREAVENYGRLDVVVTVLECNPEVEVDATTDVSVLLEAWESVLRLVELYQAAAPPMQEAGWGRFVAVLSTATKTVPEHGGDLAAMLHLGSLGFHKDVATTLGPSAVTVSAVLRTAAVPADEVADVVAFLASDRSGYLTGITIAVDAGAG